MKKLYIILCLALSPAILFSMEYVYRVQEGDRTGVESWKIENTDQGYTIEYFGEKEYWKSENNKDYITSSCFIRRGAPYGDIEQSFLPANIKNFDSQKQIWMQNGINCSYVLSLPDKKFKFFSLATKVDKDGRVKEGEIVKTDLVWIKGVTETLTLGETQFSAIKVTLTLDGLLSIFWKATYWFDTETGLLLKSETPAGPGSPVKICTLLSIAE